MHRRQWIALFVVFALAAVLRFALLERQGLWADEFFSLAMATGHSLEHPAEMADASLGDFVEAPRALPPSEYSRYLAHDTPAAGPRRVIRAVALSDTSPPLYYLLLNGWTRIVGTSDAALRLFSVLAALACLPLFVLLARRLGGPDAAVPAGLLFAVAPACVFYSTEGRMYSLVWLFAVATMWLTLRLARHGPHTATLLAWVAAGVAGLMTHYFFLFVWAAACFWLLLHPGRLSRGIGAAAAALTLGIVAPWYLHIPEWLAQWRVTDGWLEWRPHGHRPLAAVAALPWSFLSIRGVWGVRLLWDGLHAVFVGGLALVALRQLSWRFFATEERRLLWLWLLAPCLGVVAFDLLRGTYAVAVPRYAIAGMPAALLLVAVALGNLRPLLRWAFIAMLVFTCAIGVRRIALNSFRHHEAYREIGEQIAGAADPGQLVLVHSIPSGVAGLARSLEHHGASATGLGFASWVGQLGRRRVPDDLAKLAAGRREIVLVVVHEVGAPAPELDWLEANARRTSMRDVAGGRIRYFAPADGGVFFGSGPDDL